MTGTLFYAFSPGGNEALKPYIKDKLEEELGLSVDVHHFRLEAGRFSIALGINKQINVEVITKYDLLEQSINGIYRVKAKHLQHEKITLGKVALKGHFKGTAKDIVIDGKGDALDANLVYTLRVLDQTPQNIVASMKGVSLSKVLDIVGQPQLARGKIDIDINMPDIGEEFANGYGDIVLSKAFFNTDVVQKVYDLTLPRESNLAAKINMKLKGNTLSLLAHAQSNLFNLKLEDTSVGLQDKKVRASYVMDVQEMGILTQNKLAGALKIAGKVELEDDRYHVDGATGSLGGRLLFDIGESSKFHLDNVQLAKVQHLLKQPVYATGLLSGSGDTDKDMKQGRYDVHVQKGQFDAPLIEKTFGYQIPRVNNFTFSSIGKISNKILKAEVNLQSSVSDMKLTDFVYDITKKELDSTYDIFLPNIGLLIPNNKAIKRGYMRAKGEVHLGDSLVIKGTTKGVGEKLDFMYDSKIAKIEAKGLFIEKLLSLAGLPRYVTGKLASKVEVTNVKTLDGTFSLQSDNLVTQPNAMETLIDKKLKINIAVESKGELKKGKAYLNTTMQTSMGKVTLDKTVVDTKTMYYKSNYKVDIPKLEETYVLTDKIFYGPMVLVGNIAQDTILKLTGTTSSLGGNVEYTLIGDTLKGTINKVPVENILAMLGHDKLVGGNAQGVVTYNLKTKVGIADINITSFQIKSSTTTKTVKMFIGKDPARIIYRSTKLHADINGDVTTYNLLAEGTHAKIEITAGKIDKAADTHRARFNFVYDKYSVTGSIGGSVEHPSIIVDPSALMQSKTGEKIQKELDKALGGDMGKAVGGFLKGMKF